jgi:hypothetical protein
VSPKVRDLVAYVRANPALHGAEMPKAKREYLRRAEDAGLIFWGPAIGWHVSERGERALQVC